MKNFEDSEEIIFGLIIEDLDENITPENKEILKRWRKTDPANEKTYQEFLNVQINLDKLVTRLDIDAQRSWESLDKKIETTLVEAAPAGTIKLHRKNYYLLKVAASLLILCSIGYYFLSQSKNVVVVTGENAMTSLRLPDGTTLKLNAATKISYNKNNFIADRKLELIRGEVFVHVAPNQNSPFRVELGEVEARDIGTSFNIGKNDQQIMVIVEEGKVAMTKHSTRNEVLLTPGKMGIYDHQTKELIAKDNQNLNYKAWIDKRFVFTETPLTTVATELSKAYQARINIDGEGLGKRKLTATLKYQTIDSALAVISASLQCKVVKSKDIYVLSQN